MNHGFAVWVRKAGHPAGQPAGNPCVYSTKPTADRIVTRWNNESESEPFEVQEVRLVGGTWTPYTSEDEGCGLDPCHCVSNCEETRRDEEWEDPFTKAATCGSGKGIVDLDAPSRTTKDRRSA